MVLSDCVVFSECVAVKIVDANVLLYAVNADARNHDGARRWLDTALAGADTVGFSWLVLIAFLRLSTKSALFTNPLTLDEAIEQVGDWTNAPGAVIVHPGVGHLDTMGRLLSEVGVGGNLMNDAHLAALAVEKRAEIVTYDNDFGRFAGVRWRTPDAALR